MKKQFGWRSNEWGWRTDSFPSHISKVPFIWEYERELPRREIPMIFSAGVYGVEYQNDFLTPKLGFGVFEPKSQA